MRIVTVGRLVLDMRGRDGDAACLFFRRRVDLVIRLELAELLGDRSGQRGLAVVDVANRADVDVRFRAFELFLTHLWSP